MAYKHGIQALFMSVDINKRCPKWLWVWEMFLRDARFKNEAPLLIFFEKGKTLTWKYVGAPEAKTDGWFIVQAPLQIAKLITNFKGFNLLPLISILSCNIKEMFLVVAKINNLYWKQTDNLVTCNLRLTHLIQRCCQLKF